MAWVEFDDVVQEIFAVEVLPGLCFPDVINDDYRRIADSFVLPDAALAEVPETLRTIAGAGRLTAYPTGTARGTPTSAPATVAIHVPSRRGCPRGRLPARLRSG